MLQLAENSPRKRLTAAHGLHHIDYSRAAHLSIFLLEGQRQVRQAGDDLIDAVGGERDQLLLWCRLLSQGG